MFEVMVSWRWSGFKKGKSKRCSAASCILGPLIFRQPSPWCQRLLFLCFPGGAGGGCRRLAGHGGLPDHLAPIVPSSRPRRARKPVLSVSHARIGFLRFPCKNRPRRASIVKSFAKATNPRPSWRRPRLPRGLPGDLSACVPQYSVETRPVRSVAPGQSSVSKTDLALTKPAKKFRKEAKPPSGGPRGEALETLEKAEVDFRSAPAEAVARGEPSGLDPNCVPGTAVPA